MKFKKAQGAFEFLFLVGLAFVAAIIFLLASYSNIDDLVNVKEFLLLKDQGERIEQEISLAAQVQDGYRRSFLVPEKLGSREYTISMQNRSLTLNSGVSAYTARVLSVNGTIAKGMNNISRESGQVKLN